MRQLSKLVPIWTLIALWMEKRQWSTGNWNLSLQLEKRGSLLSCNHMEARMNCQTWPSTHSTSTVAEQLVVPQEWTGARWNSTKPAGQSTANGSNVGITWSSSRQDCSYYWLLRTAANVENPRLECLEEEKTQIIVEECERKRVILEEGQMLQLWSNYQPKNHINSPRVLEV